jgi:DNA-binding CsgD family transcriptional regulator
MIFQPLSPREKQILLLTMYGFNSAQVADALFISHNTVSNHLATLQRKLHTRSRLHTVIMAIALGYIKPPQLKELNEVTIPLSVLKKEASK